jgi:hypothetical protein
MELAAAAVVAGPQRVITLLGAAGLVVIFKSRSQPLELQR